MPNFSHAEAESPEWSCVSDARAAIGEVPVWAADQNALYWMDLYAPALYKIDLSDLSTSTWALPDTGGSFALWEDGRGTVVAVKNGIHELDFATGEFTLLHEAPYDQKNYRFNDGKCDPHGRFWVGTAKLGSSTVADGTSRFWCLDRGTLRDGIDGITVANGIAFSPNGSVMYVADRPGWQILAFDYDVETGKPTHRRQFATVPTGHTPDGAAVDSAGRYWIALFAVGLIACFEPTGQLCRVLRAPTAHPTMVAFGGPELRTMFVTTARDFLDDQGLAAEPLAGGIFSCELDTPGLPGHRYRRC